MLVLRNDESLAAFTPEEDELQGRRKALTNVRNGFKHYLSDGYLAQREH